MGWPGSHTPAFYVHQRTCVRCGKEFVGYASSKYCSLECIELAKRARLLAKWGVVPVPAKVTSQ